RLEPRGRSRRRAAFLTERASVEDARGVVVRISDEPRPFSGRVRRSHTEILPIRGAMRLTDSPAPRPYPPIGTRSGTSKGDGSLNSRASVPNIPYKELAAVTADSA